jgi:hypothetical protein
MKINYLFWTLYFGEEGRSCGYKREKLSSSLQNIGEADMEIKILL